MALLDELNPTGRKGVFYKEHETRKHGVRKDRLFILRYTIAGKTRTETFGWASEGVTELDAEKKIAEFRANAKSETGPTALAEEKKNLEDELRELEAAQRAAQEEAERLAADELRKNTPVAEFFDKVYLPQAKLDKKPDTWGSEERLFRHWISPVIGALTFDEISIEHLNKIKGNMVAGKRGAVLNHPRDKKKPEAGEKSAQEKRNPAHPMSAKSQQYALAVVRQVWNLACAVKPPLAAGPWPGATRQFKKPKADNKRQRFLTREEAAVLFSRLLSKSQDVHDMAVLALHCGMRAGEILNLTWNRVNLTKGELLLVDTKNGESRVAYLTEPALVMLRARALNREKALAETKDKERDQEHTRHVFLSAKGGPFHQVPVTFARTVAELGLNNGVTDPRDKVVFHTLRHTYASWLVEQGANIRLVGDLLGHKTLIMTTRYTHTTADAQRAAVEALSKSLTPTGDNVVRLADRKK
jgi:integrase